jgi:HNH endonuclease
MSGEYRGRQMVRDIGKCIYCYKQGPDVKLTREHIVPYSLGSDVYLKNASCSSCAKITRDIETHVARNIFGHMRIHTGIQTRNPEQRPEKLPLKVIRRGIQSRVELPINDHPFFLILPVWDEPGFLQRAPLGDVFPNLHWNVWYHIPET